MLALGKITRRDLLGGVLGLVALAAGATAAVSEARAADKDVLVFAAASLKNALDEIRRACETRDRQEGHHLLRGELGARQADRAGRAGRHLHLRRPRLDGLPRRART